jgi:hypothetical protein
VVRAPGSEFGPFAGGAKTDFGDHLCVMIHLLDAFVFNGTELMRRELRLVRGVSMMICGARFPVSLEMWW